MTEKILFSSESVTEGHPDKMADKISDAILDAMLEKDPNSRVACETVVTTGLVFISGEVRTESYVDIQSVVRDTVREIGYTRAKFGFDAGINYNTTENMVKHLILSLDTSTKQTLS